MPIDVRCEGCQKTLRIPDRHAGKKVKCPSCASVLEVPFVAEMDDEGIVETIPVEASGPPPMQQQDRRGQFSTEPARRTPAGRCPECGAKVREDAYRCPKCRATLDDEDDYDDDDYDDRPRVRKKSTSYEPCPKCQARDPKKVLWTAWGSFYGPAMFNHVRCRKCGYAYNGRTGRSNVLPAVIFVTIPSLLIVGIIAFVVFVMILPSLR